MKKTILFVFIFFNLVLTGCFKKISDPQQKIAFPAINVNKPMASVNQNINANQNVNATQPIPLIKEIDTSDWQTYRNEKYGFEIKYPENWYWGDYSKDFKSLDFRLGFYPKHKKEGY